MRELPSDVIVRAREYHGVVTVADLTRCGVDRSNTFRAVRSGLLERVAPQTYLVRSLADPLASAAAIQARYPDTVLERRTAAAVWGLDGFRPPPGGRHLDLDIISTRPSRCRSVPARRAAVLPDDIVTCDGLRLTSIVATLADLGNAPGVTIDAVELAVESALRARLTTEQALRLAADGGGRAAAALWQALSRRRAGTPPTESYAETRFLQAVVRPLALEDPGRQVPVTVKGRPEPYRVDFVFRRRLGSLAVEVDGAVWHGPDTPRDDNMRDHHLRLAGLHTLRVDADRIDRRPHTVQAALRRELALLEDDPRWTASAEA